MRKFILVTAIAAMALPNAALAQQRDWRHDRSEVRHDRRDVREDRRELHRGEREAHRDRRDVRRDAQYAAPYRNWRYRPVTVGYRLAPVFYGPRYYISDYGYYHLQAPPHRWLRWIRYGNDLLLVNIRTGRVLDVIHYRYW